MSTGMPKLKLYRAYHLPTVQEFFYLIKPSKKLLEKLGIDEEVCLSDWEITKLKIEK